MEDNAILKTFEGKKVSEVSYEQRYYLFLKFTDGSSLSIVPDGPEGSHIEVNVDAHISKKL
ncbi:MAG: hypothetical protein QHH10_08140 [Peptococcaceae bacterium]|jgi:hypothetical protein|nr:hypothetical protein [Peptococcaceae bacterium]MDH7525263.1 hypothetical protein [Peptococcaceae bacterium]